MPYDSDIIVIGCGNVLFKDDGFGPIVINILQKYADDQNDYYDPAVTAYVEDEFTIIPTFGEPYQLMDTLGVMTDTSLSWTSNGIEYYLISEVMSKDELIEVAQSIYELPVTSIK